VPDLDEDNYDDIHEEVINMQQINELIETKNYPDQLQYLNNTNYLIMYDNELQEYIQNIVIPFLSQWDDDKNDFYKKMIDYLYRSTYDNDNMFNNIGAYLMLKSDPPIDLEFDMNIVRRYIILIELKRNNIFNMFNVIINEYVNQPQQTQPDQLNEDIKLIVTPDKLEELPILEYSEIKTKVNTSCYCGEEFETSTIVRKVKCNHVFHPECIDKWLCEYNYKCPICREPAGVYTADIKNF